MNLTFYKYQGTGNDFVMIDNRLETFDRNNTDLIKKLCDRRFGIGADGLILLEIDKEHDFKMVYYNADGNQSTMCGNGGRCIVSFAHFLGIITTKTIFSAIDGAHEATIANGVVTLKMQNVSDIKEKPNATFLNTGSPHHVQLVTNLAAFDVRKQGAKLRYGMYGKNGSNINFAEKQPDGTFSVRTYERGVEDETLSCGTGATAVALTLHKLGKITTNSAKLNVMGGNLEVSFVATESGYEDIYLIGEATQVYKGVLAC